MKRLSLILLTFALPLLALAQTTIATVNMQEVFAALPQSELAQNELNRFNDKLKAEYATMQRTLDEKFAAYQQLDGDVPQSIKERRMSEIRQDDRAIGDFFERSQQELANKKQQLEAPIYELISAAIKEIGDKRGYTYVLDVSKTPVAYRGTGAIDITQDVIELISKQ